MSVNGMAVLGYLPRDADFEIPHRHLGLMTVDEGPLGGANIDKLADIVLRHMDIDGIVQAAGTEPVIPGRHDDPRTGKGTGGIRLAVARDRAFCFYYEDNLDMLRDAGAEIVTFSPLSDSALPAADMVYFGGGYPELHAETLSRNRSMRASVRDWAEAGKPVYAECGGLMYLSQGIGKDGATFPMAGVLPFETRMLGRPRLGYREISLRGDGVLGHAGNVRRGHEFHYSEIKGSAAGEAYRVMDSRGKVLPDEGYQYKNVLASYIHLHFGSAPDCALQIISHIRGDGKI
jgi:cobyrinic acid a,c-diamide synthase